MDLSERPSGVILPPAVMDLTSAYLNAVDAQARDGIDAARLSVDLAALCSEACEAVDGIRPLLDEFVQSLALRASEGLPARERAADLAVAFASSRRDPGALMALDALIRTASARAVARIDPSKSFADLVAQEVRTRLLVGEHPRIAEYAGHGPLAGWLRTAAVRVALNLKRGLPEQPHGALSSSVGAVAVEPELALLRARYRDDFEAAVRAALARLPARERAALCLNVRDGMSSEKIAVLYGVSRATAKRLLARARDTLATETRRELHARLRLTDSELESVARALYGDIEVSVASLLGRET
jgi:RNA polymerase sigma-70 factor (ECF subfamily)